MGRRNYLVEGVSGAGKTSVAEELERRGFDVVHGDRVLAYYGDPETGEPVVQPAGLSLEDGLAWSHARWIWPVERVRALIADHSHEVTFFCGGSRNWRHFIGLFDGVFVLEIDRDTLERRLTSRPADEFGGRPAEQALVARLHATRDGIPDRGISIDATAPVGRVVDEIVKRCGLG